MIAVSWEERWEGLQSRSFPPKIMTTMLMPALQKSGEKAARTEALRRCALTALAVERYRQMHNGALPPELSVLGEAALEDPFTGQPLLLKRTGLGYVVYSVGPDRQDDDADHCSAEQRQRLVERNCRPAQPSQHVNLPPGAAADSKPRLCPPFGDTPPSAL